MHINSPEILQPKHYGEAGQWLKAGAFPLYAGELSLNSLQHLTSRPITHAVDLSKLVTDLVSDTDRNMALDAYETLFIDARATLHGMAAFASETEGFSGEDSAFLKHVIQHESADPTMTLGDLLVAAPGDSVLMAYLIGTQARIYQPSFSSCTAEEWVSCSPIARQAWLIGWVTLIPSDFYGALVREGQVTALGFIRRTEPVGEKYAVIVGESERPLWQNSGALSPLSHRAILEAQRLASHEAPPSAAE